MDFYDLVVEDDFSEPYLMTKNKKNNKRAFELTNLLLQLKAFIDDNYCVPNFGLVDVNNYIQDLIKGSETNISDEYIKRHFKDTFGDSIIDYLNDLRSSIPIRDVNDYLDRLFEKRNVNSSDIHYMKLSILKKISSSIKNMEQDDIPASKICFYLGLSPKEYEQIKDLSK